VSLDQVLTSARAAGFKPMDQPKRNGETFELHAIGADGSKWQVLFDVHDANIVSMLPMDPEPSAPAH
jgi:hypothetical protein